MPKAKNPVEAAARHVAVLKAIVLAERKRAEDKPLDGRNLALGILDADRSWKHDAARDEIAALFNALELLLDHFNIAHLAAAFEHASQPSIRSALGVARDALDKKRKAGNRWPGRLLREAESFKSLHSIGELIGLSGEDKETFDLIRDIRNKLDHGTPITTTPDVTGESARLVLGEALERLKG